VRFTEFCTIEVNRELESRIPCIINRDKHGLVVVSECVSNIVTAKIIAIYISFMRVNKTTLIGSALRDHLEEDIIEIVARYSSLPAYYRGLVAEYLVDSKTISNVVYGNDTLPYRENMVDYKMFFADKIGAPKTIDMDTTSLSIYLAEYCSTAIK
jgi:hypothetical protein